MTELPKRRPTRVILGATCYADAEAGIAVAVGLARVLSGELQGLLVEEESIVAYAGLPFARVIGPGGRAEGGLSAERMRAAFRRDARAFERRLAEAAGAAALGWSFAARPGRLATVLGEIAGAGDFILLGHRAARPSEGEVVFLPAPDGDPALGALAERLAGALGRPLRVLAGTAGAAAPVGAALERLPTRAAVMVRLARLSPAAVLAEAGAVAPGDVTDLAETARCPVIVQRPVS